MAVHIVSKKSVSEYITKDPKNGPALRAWISYVESQTWESPLDIVRSFGAKSVDILGKKDTKTATSTPNRVVIDVKGNHLRIIGKYQIHGKLKATRLYIKWIGTHAEYDKICSRNEQYEVDQFK